MPLGSIICVILAGVFLVAFILLILLSVVFDWEMEMTARVGGTLNLLTILALAVACIIGLISTI